MKILQVIAILTTSLTLSINANAQTNLSEFGYIGFDLGFGQLGDDFDFGGGATLKNSGPSYGGQILYMKSFNNLSFGFNASSTRIRTQASYDGSTKVDWNHTFTGAGLVVGQIMDIGENRKAAGYVSADYYFSVKTEQSCNQVPTAAKGICEWGNDHLNEGNTGAIGMAAGYIANISDGFSVGLGGRVFFAEAMKNPYSIFLTAGISF